jgi:ABC-2 type transport system permease protein
VNATVAVLTTRSLLGRRRVLLLTLLSVVLLVLAIASRLLAGADEPLAVGLLGGFALGTVVPLLGLIAGTGAIGPEIDDGSIVYLLAKPLRRLPIAVTKVAVAIAVVTAFGVLPTLVAGLVLLGEAGGVPLGYTVGALAAAVTYSALFLLVAVLTRNAVVVGLIYALIWESLFGQLVPGAQLLSVQQWALAVTERVLGADADRLGVEAAVSFPTGVAALAGVAIVATWYAGHRLRSLRLTTDE